MGHEAVEVRVHGIGSHPPSAALGSLSEEVGATPNGAPASSGGDSQTGTLPRRLGGQYLPPKIPSGHDLVLTNWSRTSRSVARFLWYIALPITLVNVAARMRPNWRSSGADDPSGELNAGRSAMLRLCGGAVIVSAHAIAIALTILFVMWTTATLETIFLFTVHPINDGSFGSWLPLIAAAILIASVLIRILLRKNRISLVLAMPHVVVIFGTAWVLHVVRPASHIVLSNWWVDVLPEWLVVYTPRHNSPETCYQLANVDCDPRPDILVLTVAIGIIGAFILASFLYLLQLIMLLGSSDQDRGRLGLALPGAGMLLVVGMVIFNAVASLLRLGVEWLTVYFTTRRLEPLPEGWEPAVRPSQRTVLAYYDRAAPDFGANYIPIWALTALVVTCSVAIVINAARVRLPSSWQRTPPDEIKGKHRAMVIHMAIVCVTGQG
jgi:hypothetical protein